MANKTLQQFSEEAVFSSLGETARSAKCCFSSGGTVPQLESVDLVYKKQSGEWSSLQLPADMAGGEKVQQFLDACSTASFGLDDKTVTDKSYRDALKLEPENFQTDFQVANTSILSSITSIMSMETSIRADLYKLNVYSTGGHFKAHVDTPQSKEMFGSLVVCLPSQFTGGALVTRHQGRQVTFDWSSSSPATQWAAFYSDVEHEVLPVTSGHRITLTYNLYFAAPFQPPPPSCDVTVSPLYRELQSALQSPNFIKEGGTLGFFCQHKYIRDKCAGFEEMDVVSFLKGGDMIVYQAARALGLPVSLKPISKLTVYDDDEEKGEEYVINTFAHKVKEYEWGCDERLEELQNIFGEVTTTEHIHWCVWSEQRNEPLLSTSFMYGNDAASIVMYYSAALLVQVPEFTSARGLATLAEDKNVPDKAISSTE